jgi:hypothetical protein
MAIQPPGTSATCQILRRHSRTLAQAGLPSR